MTASEVAAALRQHPGVRDAAVVLREAGTQGEKLVAYVVPNPGYFEQSLSVAEEERRRLQKWSKTFDLSQLSQDAAAAPLGFNTAGWNSSYTRQPIPAEEMREWIDNTVNQILALRPRNALEIGCGSGLLLLRLAPQCSRYVGVDFSAISLQRLREQLARMPDVSGSVELLERPADNLKGVEPASVDTIIINSVVQYFPSASYLIRVLDEAVALAKPGGKIFVGDVLSLPLLEAYSASVELFQAPAAMDLAELHERVLRRINQQPHLVLSPSFFLALQRRSSRISHVHIRPKRGRFDNELTRFRFDVVLSIGPLARQPFEPAWQEWPSHASGLATLRHMLQQPGFGSLGYRHVPNARVESDMAAANQILRGATGSVGSLRSSLSQSTKIGVHPELLYKTAEELGVSVDLSWTGSWEDGAFDVLIRRQASDEPVAWPEGALLNDDPCQYANIPGRAVFDAKLIQQLVEYSRKTLPPDCVPAAIVLVPKIPAKSNGELDRDALRDPAA